MERTVMLLKIIAAVLVGKALSFHVRAIGAAVPVLGPSSAGCSPRVERKFVPARPTARPCSRLAVGGESLTESSHTDQF